MSPKSILCAFAALLSQMCASPSMGQGTEFTYQGRLSNGTNPTTGIYDLRFAIFDARASGEQIAEPITENGVEVRNGLFSVTLDFGPAVFSGPGRWLEISVRANGEPGFTTLVPRQPITPVPYAISAAKLSGTLSASQLTGLLASSALAGEYPAVLNFNNESNRYAGDATALRFGGFGYCNLPCYWNLNGNSGTTAGQSFIGTTDNNSLEFRVNRQRAWRLEPTLDSPNLIGGFVGNYVDGDGVGNSIGGGGTSNAENMITVIPGLTNSAWFGTIAGGAGNHISGSSYSSIGGGLNNQILEHFTLDPSLGHNTISGGAANRIFWAKGSTIAGGTNNAMIGDANDLIYDSTVGGGSDNLIITDIDALYQNTIAGGRGNKIFRSSRATISGGFSNTISLECYGATLAGGIANRIDSSAARSTIAGGENNSVGALAVNATISGGQNNRVVGSYGTVSGGLNNVATNYAFAAGNHAKAVHQGAFVWAAGNTNDFPSSTSNRVHFYAPGGVEVAYAGQDADGRGLKWVMLASLEPGRVINAYNGAYLSEGGAWTDTSDRNAKENFEAVDPREILERVTTLPLNRWSYRSESNSVRHLGPVAQDFHKAFGLGADDKHIAGLDSSGVALAAIQGLSQELRLKQAEIDLLKRRLEALEKRLDRLAR